LLFPKTEVIQNTESYYDISFISPVIKHKLDRRLLTTVHLITAIITVDNAIAHQMSLKTLAAGTLEVARTPLIHATHLI
jgi:hypothetical protein